MRNVKALFVFLGMSLGLSYCSDGKDNPSYKPGAASPAEADTTDSGDGAADKGGAGAQTGTPSGLSFTDIRPLSKKFCEDCHLDDGFGKEEVWKTLKASAITRLQMKGEKGTMPPPETTLGKTMTAEDKAKIISWLETIDQVDREQIGDVRDPAANTKISGDLKAVADAYCVSCHTDGAYVRYWINAKSEAIKRINNKSMPPGKTLPAEDKQKILNALNAL